jgi:hypothetical protein
MILIIINIISKKIPQGPGQEEKKSSEEDAGTEAILCAAPVPIEIFSRPMMRTGFTASDVLKIVTRNE